jgi:RNA polymerase sigma-70 factor, ECF subfamily
LPWLYGVARLVLANHRRGQGRVAALAARALRNAPKAEDDHAALANLRTDVGAAMRRLRPVDREVLRSRR